MVTVEIRIVVVGLGLPVVGDIGVAGAVVSKGVDEMVNRMVDGTSDAVPGKVFEKVADEVDVDGNDSPAGRVGAAVLD